MAILPEEKSDDDDEEEGDAIDDPMLPIIFLGIFSVVGGLTVVVYLANKNRSGWK